MFTTRSSVNTQGKVLTMTRKPKMPKDGHMMKTTKPAMHKPGHPSSRHDEAVAKGIAKRHGGGKTESGRTSSKTITKHQQHEGKTTKGHTGGGLPLKRGAGAHVPMMGGTKKGIRGRKKISSGDVAKAMSRIK